jgi:DNA-binding transcriptional LysR family regulator
MNDVTGTPSSFHLRLRHLLLVQLLAEHGSLGEAAKAMNRTQPALTKMLQELESAIGARLFERGRQGTSITAEGEAFARRATVVLNEWAQLRSDVDAARTSGIVTIRIGSTPLISLGVLPEALSQFRAEWPNVHVQLHEGSMHALLQELAASRVDLVIGRYSGEVEHNLSSEWMVQECLQNESLVVVAGSSHPAAESHRASWQQLAAAEWILPPLILTTRRLLEMEFLRAGERPPIPIVETSSFATAIAFAHKLNALTLVPEVAAKFSEDLGLIQRVDCDMDTFRAPISILRRKSIAHPPPIEALLLILHNIDARYFTSVVHG